MTDCNIKSACMNRREFLVKTGLVAGGAILTISSLRSAAFGAMFEDVTVAIDAASPLAKIGGSLIVDSTAGKIIVIHTDKDKFAAFSAKCTHKGAKLNYNPASKQLECPSHGSKFNGSTGEVINGPAGDPLAKYATKGTDASVVVTVGT